MSTFFERNRQEVIKRGYEPARLPPGQYLTDRFPVLHAGDVPPVDLDRWQFKVFGAVEYDVTLSWAEFQQLPRTDTTADIHCVTKWSKFDTQWSGVPFHVIAELAKPLPEAQFVLQHAEYGFTVNTPLA